MKRKERRFLIYMIIRRASPNTPAPRHNTTAPNVRHNTTAPISIEKVRHNTESGHARDRS